MFTEKNLCGRCLLAICVVQGCPLFCRLQLYTVEASTTVWHRFHDSCTVPAYEDELPGLVTLPSTELVDPGSPGVSRLCVQHGGIFAISIRSSYCPVATQGIQGSHPGTGDQLVPLRNSHFTWESNPELMVVSFGYSPPHACCPGLLSAQESSPRGPVCGVFLPRKPSTKSGRTRSRGWGRCAALWIWHSAG